MKLVLVSLSLFAVAFAAEICKCTREMKPVCGSNGNTYNNKCELECAARSDETLTLVSEGKCVSPCLVCPALLAPVCGTDGITYDNKCLLQCSMETNPNLLMAYPGPCTCVCTKVLKPVCGSNGITYDNPCLLECAAKTSDIQLVKNGEC